MPKLLSLQFAYLEEPFSYEEIKKAMFSMKPIKSPSPDGIVPVFFQNKWDIVGEGFSQAAKKISRGGGGHAQRNQQNLHCSHSESRQTRAGKSIPTY